MYAQQILQKSLSTALDEMHARRAGSLLGAVSALVSCKCLVLMELARAYPGAARVRAPLKRLDRLLSNVELALERASLYAAMNQWLITDTRPVIAIDWSPLGRRERYHLLRAVITLEGRPLTLYEEVHPEAKLGNAKVERDFLAALAEILPPSAKPIILSDAGFRTPWFKAVQAHGWDYIGRVRDKNTNIRFAQQNTWQRLATLINGAPCKAESLGSIELTRRSPWQCHLVRSRSPSKGRKLLTQHGKPSRANRSRKAQRRARETCLLVTSLTEPAKQIVKLYRRRMQIEESFRDLKSERYGVGFEHSLTRDPARIEILLLIHALATFVAYLMALAASEQDLTVVLGGVVGKRRHYSKIWLGWQLLRLGWLPIPSRDQLFALLRSQRLFASG